MRLAARSLSLLQGGRKLLDNVDLTFGSKDFAVLAGANGAGKTLLLKALVGLVEPDQGAVSGGTNCRPALVFQEPDAQILGRTVEEDLAIGIPERGEDVDARLNELLVVSDLMDRRRQSCHRLSGGEKRRLTIASAVASSPDLLLLDEPFTYLDFQGVVSVLEEILAIYQRGCGIVIVTHDLDKVLAHATRLVLMRDGRLFFDGSTSAGLELVAEAGVRRPPGRAESLSWLNGVPRRPRVSNSGAGSGEYGTA